MHNEKENKEKEINYYLSLGYSNKQAERIASLEFDEPVLASRPGIFSGASSITQQMSRVFKSAAPVKNAKSAPIPEVSLCVSEPQSDSELFDSGFISEPELIDVIGTEAAENVRSASFKDFEDSRFKSVLASPTSTFRTTYNTAAATVLMSNFDNMLSTYHSMVRTEEILNFIDYKLNIPENDKFSVTPEFIDNGDGTAKLFVGIKGQAILPKRQNIVLLIDTSGSMCVKVLQIRATIATVFARMNAGDIFSIVTYSDVDHTFINGMKKNDIDDIDKVLDKLKKMSINGCTYGSKGIETAYTIVKENFVEDGINRVIMVTDGDLNFGITDEAGLKGLISKKKESGAFFSAIGTGILNLKDDNLEALAKNGNGNYFVINTVDDVKKCLGDRYESLVYPIAVDVKAQVEFNPEVVSEYRLIGFENRMLSHEDFTNDQVISETFGSGSYCVALYELKLAGNNNTTSSAPLKYQKSLTTGSDEICTVSIRYKDVEETVSKQLSFPILNEVISSENSEKAWKAAKLCEDIKKAGDKGDERRALKTLKEMCY